MRGELIEALHDAVRLLNQTGAHANRLAEIDVDFTPGDFHAALQQARIGIRAARAQAPAVQDLPE